MANFEKCHKCKPPERHPGCHSKCKYYIEDKEKLEREKAADKLRKDLDRYNKQYPNY